MNRARWSALLDGVSFAALTILVWGVDAFQRGLWQDDVQALGEAFRRSTRPFLKLFAPFPSPLRRLTVLPSAIAYATPQPIWALHILSAATWLAHGLLAGWIVALLLPGRRWTRFVVVCLTLTATSDFTTGSIVPLAYNVAALLILAAVGCALFWLERGRVVALIASAILSACSLLTMDVALPAIPFLIGLFIWIGASRGRDARAPLVALLVAWAIVLVPIAIVEWSFLHDPTSYAAIALLPLSKSAWLWRSISLWLQNFLPWRWAFARHDWYARPAPVMPVQWMVLGSLVAAVLFVLRVRTKRDGAHELLAEMGPSGNVPLLAALFVVMALATNAAYAAVQFTEFLYRSHILSRVWASIAIGLMAGWAAARAPRLRWVALAVVTAFVFLGTWGGIERQDFYLASWREHQRELASIVTAAPALRQATVVILRSSSTSNHYRATAANYLAKHWLRLLYGDPNMRTLLVDPQRGTGCTPSAHGVDCWVEDEAECVKAHTCKPTHFSFTALVVMDYDESSSTYRLVRSLQGDPFAQGHEREAELYRPEKRIVAGPWTAQQHWLLLR
jgi:hypothetical protein